MSNLDNDIYQLTESLFLLSDSIVNRTANGFIIVGQNQSMHVLKEQTLIHGHKIKLVMLNNDESITSPMHIKLLLDNVKKLLIKKLEGRIISILKNKRLSKG